MCFIFGIKPNEFILPLCASPVRSNISNNTGLLIDDCTAKCDNNNKNVLLIKWIYGPARCLSRRRAYYNVFLFFFFFLSSACTLINLIGSLNAIRVNFYTSSSNAETFECYRLGLLSSFLSGAICRFFVRVVESMR